MGLLLALFLVMHSQFSVPGMEGEAYLLPAVQVANQFTLADLQLQDSQIENVGKSWYVDASGQLASQPPGKPEKSTLQLQVGYQGFYTFTDVCGMTTVNLPQISNAVSWHLHCAMHIVSESSSDPLCNDGPSMTLTSYGTFETGNRSELFTSRSTGCKGLQHLQDSATLVAIVTGTPIWIAPGAMDVFRNN